MTFTIEKAGIVSLFVQSATWGFYASLFVQSTSAILTRHNKPETRRVNTRLLLVSIVMFLLSTVYVFIALSRFLHAFLCVENSCGHNASVISAELGNLSSVVYIVQTGAYGFQTVFGDGFMIYRAYMVWGGYLPVCILPILTLVASTASGVTFMFISSHSTVLVLVFFWLTLFTNGCCTALIAGRIIWIRRRINNHYESGGSHRSKFGPAVTVIVESGAIYSFSLTIVIALYYLYGLTEQNFPLRAMPQVMGVIFSFIIVRVASRVSIETLASESNSSAQRTALTDMFHSSRREEAHEKPVVEL